MTNAGQSNEDILRDFDAQWREGRHPSIDAALRLAGDKSRAKLLVSLIDLDAKHRCSRGEPTTIQSYSARFPQLSGAKYERAVVQLQDRIEKYRSRYENATARADVAETIAVPQGGDRSTGAAPGSEALDVTRPSSINIEDMPSSDSGQDSHTDTRTYAGSSIASFDGETMAYQPGLDAASGGRSSGQSTGSASQSGGPDRIGKYVVIADIDRGGQATVYRAAHPQLGTEVAIKIFHRACPESVDQLQSEGRALAQLKHEGIAAVYDLDVHEGRPFVVMEYLRGRNLAQYMSDRNVDPRRAAEVIAKVARALGAAHRLGLLHLDVKPHNILIDEQGEPKLIDFGLARFRQTAGEEKAPSGSLTGTLLYMSPEQARADGQALSARSDIYSLGCVLFELLTGERPYAGNTAAEVLAQAREGSLRHDALDECGAPAKLLAVCRRAVANDPRDRYNSADELADDLEACLVEKKNTPLILGGVAAGVGVLLIVGLLVAFVGGGDDAPETAGTATDNPRLAGEDIVASAAPVGSAADNPVGDEPDSMLTPDGPPPAERFAPPASDNPGTPTNLAPSTPLQTERPPAQAPPAFIEPLRVFAVTVDSEQDMRPGSMVKAGGRVRLSVNNLPARSAVAMIIQRPRGSATTLAETSISDNDTSLVFPAESRGFLIDKDHVTWLFVSVGSTSSALDVSSLADMVHQLGVLAELPPGYILRWHDDHVIAPRETVSGAEQRAIDNVTQAITALRKKMKQAEPSLSFSAVAFAPQVDAPRHDDAPSQGEPRPRDDSNAAARRSEPPDRPSGDSGDRSPPPRPDGSTHDRPNGPPDRRGGQPPPRNGRPPRR